MRRIAALLLVTLTLVRITEVRASDNWPQWRGPNATGIAAQGEFPVKFSANEGVAWKAKLPGPGSSSPTVWGDAIFVTAVIGGEDGVCRYNFDGQQAWQKTLGPGEEGKHRNGTGANPSPATDGKHVVVYFKSGRVACLDFDGHELWQVNLQDKYGKDTLWWDLGTSPIIVGNNAVIAVMQAGDSYLVALDLDSGNVAWKTKRQYERPEESDQAYTTPQLAKIDGKDVLVTWGADHLTGHDAATGKLLWEVGGFNPEDIINWRVIASQAVGGDTAVVAFGRGKFLGGIKLGGEGDVTKTNWLWRQEQDAGADVPTPIIDAGQVILLIDSGKIVVRELKTGNVISSVDLPKNRNRFYASPVLAGGNLYCCREDGKVFVVPGTLDNGKWHFAKDKIVENDMGERVIATPVPVRSGLLIRGEKHLFRIGGDDAKVAASK
jgi:outer membrane protein assembly factor BamB